MNGVCVRWRGWLDIERLDGVGCLEYDEERAQIEDAILREQLERYNQRVRDFEEKQRLYRSQHDRHVEAEVEVRTSRYRIRHFSFLSLGLSPDFRRYQTSRTTRVDARQKATSNRWAPTPSQGPCVHSFCGTAKNRCR
ncbi:Protein big brother [Araneus ventricosus]|uniref:Protein big brother n=1 Tax=Araneus ventricosus TaxID=182803 RepID=A0A4Y2TPK9_ARAVE|nr:Protein big brother [Araneus ventricosus]